MAFYFSEICMNHIHTFLFNIIALFNMKLMWYSRAHGFVTNVSTLQRMNKHRLHIVIGHYGHIFRIYEFSFFRHNADNSSSDHPKFRIRLTHGACYTMIPISKNSEHVSDCITANTLKPCPSLFQYNVRLKKEYVFQHSISLWVLLILASIACIIFVINRTFLISYR